MTASPDLQPDVAAARALWTRLMAAVEGAAIAAVADLGVADHLDGGPQPVAELARACGADERMLQRVLRFLAAHGVFREERSGWFEHSDLSRPLCRSAPASQAAFGIYAGRLLYPALTRLTEALRSSRPAFELAFGEPLFEALATSPPLGGLFTRAMADSAGLRRDLALAWPWPPGAAIVDIGGGDGALLTSILAANPELRGVIVDRPHLADAADTRIRAGGLEGRCRFVAADFFRDELPAGDVYLLSAVLHDWDDGRAAALLRRCRQALLPSGRAVILDAVLPDGPPVAHPALTMDLVMLAMTEGRERTESEWRALLRRGGCAMVRFERSWRVALIEAECSDEMEE